MNIETTKKLAAHIFRLLKVNEVVFPIGRTNKGNLGLKFQANSDDFEIYLDAVPLPTKSMLEDDNNIELKKMIEKYWFTDSGMSLRDAAHPTLSDTANDNKTFTHSIQKATVNLPGKIEGNTVTLDKAPKKRGRPKKVV